MVNKRKCAPLMKEGQNMIRAKSQTKSPARDIIGRCQRRAPWNAKWQCTVGYGMLNIY